MKYKGTRQLLTGILAVMLTIPVIVGLASPIRTQAASKVGVQYRFADGAEHEAKNRVGIRSVVIDGNILTFMMAARRGAPIRQISLLFYRLFYRVGRIWLMEATVCLASGLLLQSRFMERIAIIQQE